MVDVNATKCKLEYANNDLMKMSDIFLQKLEDEDLNDEVENCIDKCIRLKCELDLRHNGQETSEKKVNLHVKMPKLELPTFDGGLESWLSFKDLFYSAIGSNSQIPEIEKLQYLKGQLRGEALRLVNAFPITADNYVEVWQTLLTRYDNPKDLIFTQIDNALRLPKLADDNHKSMFKLLDSCNEIVRTVKVLGYQIDSLSDVFFVEIIQDKLDKTTRKQWELQNNPRVVPSIKDLMEFLEIRAKSLQNLPNKDANVEKHSIRRESHKEMEESSIKRETAPRMEVQQKQWGHPGRSPMDYSSKRRPCRICLNRGHAGRFHPENRNFNSVEFDEKLSPYEKSDLIKLIKENKEAFAAHKMDIGHIKADPIRIKLTSQTPISLKPFRPSFSDNIEIKRQIEELLKYNVIRPSYSSYASPAMLVNKRNEGKIRLVIDYRKLNDIIKRDSEPIPRIDSILDKLSEANIFTTLDLLSGYHHLDIHPDDKEYTAFTTTHGLYEFNKLSFGLKNSPSQFQRVLRQILNKYDVDFCMNYFDDFIIFSNNFQEHLTHLKVILDICIKENIKLKLSKCKFATYQISFLGYEISNHQFSPSTNNIETIRKLNSPRNKKDLQRVLGSINIYSKFIPNYAKLRLPLNNLLKKDVKWKWDEECETAFSKLKNMITSKPILAIYNPKYPIHLYTDASQEQIGSILKQEQPDGLLKPIAYRSRRMTSYESNYCVTEQECLAIIDAVDFFLPYLDGVHFTIHTDHACLKYLKNIKNPKGRLFRWSLKLSMFDFEIKHIRGTENKEADFLSRYPIAHFVSDPELKQAQFDDNINDRKYTKFNGLLTIKKKGLIKSVVPPSLREKVLIRAHQDYGHIGVSKMLNLISPIYYWPYLIQEISNYVKHCEVCQLNKISHQKKFGLLESLPPAKDPFDLVSIDTVGGLNYYNSTKKFLHIIIDHATRYIWAFPSKSQTTDSYINCLNKIFQIQKPKQFLSDRAPSFTSPRFRKYLINNNIKQLLTSSSRPQCNGLNERLNQTIITRLRCKFNNLKGKSIPWTKLLDSVLNEYNNTPHSITGYTPTYLLYGKLPYDPPLKESEFYPPIDTARTNAYNNTLKFHQINKIRYDQHYQPSTFKVGDKVWLQTFYHPDNRKLMPPMSGPFTILKQISPVNYEIDKPQSNLGKTTMVIHSSKLRPYYSKEGFELKLTKSKIPTLEKKTNQQVAPKKHIIGGYMADRRNYIYHTHTLGRAATRRASSAYFASGGCMSSGNTPSLARAESPSKAEEKPARLGSKAQPSAELPARNALKFNSSMKSTKNQRYANPATGGKDANPAAPTDFAAASSSEAAAQAHRNWAELTEDSNSEYEGNFTIVQKRKRRRGSANSSPAAAPSSNLGGARTNRRPQSSAGWAPRAQEVRTTRAHIVEARARQASSTEDHCVYVERSPELEPYHYMRAMDRMFGSTREVFQVTKMNGHFLVGLANRGMAARLVNEGLEVEGTLHRVFPFRKRAERIMVGNLPFFVGVAAVISALTPLGRVTSIAPKLMKAGPYTYNDGRREAFIILREGMTIEGLPTRLNITIKGEAWPAYLSSGIRCSRCRGQGHRRANCPLLAGRTNAPGPATPTSPTSVPSASAPGLPQQPSAQPPPPASPSPAMEVSEVPSTSRAALPPAAPRQSPPVAPATPTEMAPPAPPPVAPAPSLRAPGSHGPAVPTLDVEMSIEETSTFRAALKTSPAAVPPTPPLPAPQPAGPIPPAPDEEEMTLIMREECMVIEILKKLKHLTCLRPLYQSGIQPNDLKDAILFIDERESLMARLTPAMRGVLAEFLSAAIEPARGNHPDVSSDLANMPKLVPAESPESADLVPGRPSVLSQTGENLSPKNGFQRKISLENSENKENANSPAGDLHANLAAARGDVTAPKTAAMTSATPASPASLNWADSEMAEVDDNEGFIVVKGKKRRLGSTSPEHAARQPNKPGNQRSTQQQKRPTGPRAVPLQEIKATRANIADARARQASTNHEYYVFVELCPDIPDYSYLKAMSTLLGGPRSITQFHRMNGHFIVGLADKKHANHLVADGLEIEGTTLKVFPFRKRAERIVVANLPGFVEDSTIATALGQFGRVTSIAPILVKMGEFTFTDGRREAFILLHEGVRLETLPTRMTIHSKGDTLSAFLSFGIKCSKCGKQGHRRANCPALARQGNSSPRQAASPTDARPPLPPPQRPRKPAPAPATPAKTSTEAQAIPSAPHPAEPMDLAQPAPAALPALLAAPRPLEPGIPSLDHKMALEKMTSPPSTPARGESALKQLLKHIEETPTLSIDWDKLPGLNCKNAQQLLTSEATMKRIAPTLTEEQVATLNKLHETFKASCPDSNSTIRKTLQKTRKQHHVDIAFVQETNAFHLGSGQDLCLGYNAVVLAHPVAISGSVLACVFGPGVAVIQQRVLWPGHIALATIDVHGKEMTAIVVHLAHEPRERNRQLELLAATAAQEEEGACWIIGDFNIRDRGPSSSSSSDALAALLDLAALVDVATQFDAAHLPTRVAMHGDQVESNRLDRILVPAGVLDRVSIYATSHYHLSDHRLVLLQVGPPTTAVSSPTQPRLAAMLRSGLALEHLAGYIRELEEDAAHDDDDGTFWDRWTSIKAGLLAEARSLHDPRHAASDSYVYRARRYIAAQLEASSIRADYPSLPDLARAIRLRRPVSVIRDDEDNVIEGPELRRRAFATFRPRFARPTTDPAAGAAFIASSAPTTTCELSEEDPLHRPDISPSEIANAIEHLPRGKAPGWDGLPCELLVAFNEDFFAEALARVFAASRLRGALPPSTRRSSICLVPKARGGRGLDGYRPVALPSADYRVLAAILHRRLKPHLRTLVPECQTYAVPGRSPSWNIAKVTDAVEEATAMGSPLTVMGIDLESAFDSLDRGFLESLMTSLRLPPAFMGWINILYAGADATIRAGGFHTTAFPLLNGLRQGCAVSAALFSIATGPLLRRLELTLGVGNVIAYADDIVLLFHRDEEFERVATVLEDFKRASGIAVNLGKSAGLWCGAWRNRGDSPLGASWSTTSIRVLGLDIAPRSSVAHQEQHLLALLESACRRWTPFTRGLSLVGRSRAANSLVSSTIQHHLHGYLPSPPTIAKLQAKLARFVWGPEHTAWLPAAVMARPVAIGGLGLLDLATQLQLACLKGVQVALRGGRNAFSWLVESGEAWIQPPPDGTRLQPRRLRLLKLWEEASNILSLNHRALPTAQLLDLPIIGGCRFLRPPDLLAPARWRGARVRDLLAEGHLIARPTRSVLADAATLSAFCRRLTSENAVGFGAESAPSSSSLAAAVVLRGTATPFLNVLTTRSARRALDRPRLAATPISSGKLSLEATNLVWADSPFNADELPARYGLIPQTSAELSAENYFQLQNSEEMQEMASYANLPTGERHANSATTRDSATALPSSGVILGQQKRKTLPMDHNPVTEDDYTIVQNKRKRRDTAAPRVTTAQPNSAGTAARRQRSSPPLIPRVQEIRTTRTHIAEARARQATCTEEQCFFLEYCPGYETYQYLRAIGGIVGGTKNIIQFSKVNGQYLVGLTSRAMAEQLIREGLEVEGTLLRTFPFRRSATRITIGNLPFFVRDAVVIDALARFGRVTSIAPKQLKVGEFDFTDGRREAFILLHDGITVEKLPTRFDIKIMGEAWPAYITYGIKCSRCHGQGHRRASCPLLHGQSTTSRRASPPFTTGLPPSTAPGLPGPSPAAPTPPAPTSPAIRLSGAQPDARAVSPPSTAPRPTTPAPPASSVHVAAPAPPPEAPAPEHPASPRSAATEPTPPARPDFTTPCGPLPAQGTLGPATHTPDDDMITTEETSASSPAASPGSAGQKPGRPSILTPTGSENSSKNEFHGEIYGEKSNSREYVNPPADGGNVNLAAARVDVTSGMAAASSSNGAALTIRNWADCDEVMNPGTDDDFTVVKNKKRRRESSDSPTAATPSSNSGGARSGRRVQSSARSVPRAQEIPTTRAHIAEARARQTSSAEEHCVYLEHGPELQPFHYLRALDRLLGGTAGVVQVSKVNGHQLLGLANRGLAERLINNGLEVEGTLLRAFPFRKRAERITVGNLPFFVEDSAIIKALGPYGRITSIAPKMMKAGPYTYTDGRREAFIVLHEGVTTERLPTRLNITIKGEAWPAYLSSGIKCSRCHGQGHRRANCPLLAGRVNATRSAPPASPAGLPPTTTPAPAQRPTPQHSAPAPPLEISGASPAPRAAIHPAGAPRPSPTAPSASPTEETPPAPPPVTPDPSSQAPSDPASQEILGPANIAQDIEMTAVEESIPPSASSNKKCTRIDLAAFIKRSPSVSFAGTDALGLGREEVLDLLSSRTKAHKRGRHLTPPQSNALAGLVNQILNLRPGGDSNSTIYKVLRQVLSELTTGTAAVPPATTLPAPRPAEPAPPAPQKRESTPAMATPPPPPSAQMEGHRRASCPSLARRNFDAPKRVDSPAQIQASSPSPTVPQRTGPPSPVPSPPAPLAPSEEAPNNAPVTPAAAAPGAPALHPARPPLPPGEAPSYTCSASDPPTTPALPPPVPAEPMEVAQLEEEGTGSTQEGKNKIRKELDACLRPAPSTIFDKTNQAGLEKEREARLQRLHLQTPSPGPAPAPSRDFIIGFTIASINARGLAIRNKSLSLCHLLRQHRVDIALVQETNTHHLDGAQDLCLGYDAITAPPDAISGSGLACIYAPSVTVSRHRILWPGHIVLATFNVHGQEMTVINVHLSHDQRERIEQLRVIEAAAVEEEEEAWVLGDFNIRDDRNRDSISMAALGALCESAALLDAAPEFDAAHLPTRVAAHGDLIESSRLDRILAPARFLEVSTSYAIAPFHLSDHRMVLLRVGPPAAPSQPCVAATLRSGLAQEHMNNYLVDIAEEISLLDAPQLWDRWTLIKAGILAEARSLHDPRHHDRDDGYIGRAQRYIRVQVEASSTNADYPSLPDLARLTRHRRPAVTTIRDENGEVIEGPVLRRKALDIFRPRFARPSCDPAEYAAFIGATTTTPIELGEEDPLHRAEVSEAEHLRGILRGRPATCARRVSAPRCPASIDAPERDLPGPQGPRRRSRSGQLQTDLPALGRLQGNRIDPAGPPQAPPVNSGAGVPDVRRPRKVPLLEHRAGHRRRRGGYCPRHAAGRGFRGSAVRLRLPGPRVSNVPPGVPPAPPTGLRGMDSSTLRRGGRHNKGRGLPDRRLQTTQRRETGLRSERGALQHRDGTAAASPGDDPRRGQRHRLRRRHRPPVPSRRRIRAGGDRPRGLQAGLWYRRQPRQERGPLVRSLAQPRRLPSRRLLVDHLHQGPRARHRPQKLRSPSGAASSRPPGVRLSQMDALHPRPIPRKPLQYKQIRNSFYSLAKAGALGLSEARESTIQLDERDLLRTIKTQCLQEWKSNAAHMTGAEPGGTSTGSVLPREQQSLISRLKSGHLRTMTFQNGCK
ncbi:hypothetical protein LAZ67_1000791, partial [Cordylochernes scorpioides]